MDRWTIRLVDIPELLRLKRWIRPRYVRAFIVLDDELYYLTSTTVYACYMSVHQRRGRGRDMILTFTHSLVSHNLFILTQHHLRLNTMTSSPTMSRKRTIKPELDISSDCSSPSPSSETHRRKPNPILVRRLRLPNPPQPKQTLGPPNFD